MEEKHDKNNKQSRPGVRTVKQAVAVVFRHRNLVRKSFLWLLLGGLLAIYFFGLWYESDMEILITHKRTPVAITPDSSPRSQFAEDSAETGVDINNEEQILTSQDVLKPVVIACDLQVGHIGLTTPMMVWIWKHLPGYWDTLLPKAVSKLSTSLVVTPVQSSGVVTVSYSSPYADDSACVMQALAAYYMEDHIKAYKAPSMTDFFAKGTDNYWRRLSTEEQQLVDFSRTQGAVDAEQQTGTDVTQESNFLASLRQTQASIAQTKEQIRADEEQLKIISPRIDTLISSNDNATLLATLESTLNNLELQRTDLLRKYQPDYPLVVAVDKQISQTRASIAAAEKGPVHDRSTDQNPTYTFLVGDLVKARSQEQALEGEAAALERSVQEYQSESAGLNAKATTEADMQRNITADQGNYLLYLGKREEAKISDMLDRRRVFNVAIIEQPTIPGTPSFNPLLLILAALLVAPCMSIGLAFLVDYLDPSFRTADELSEMLDVPVFASIPENGH